MGNFGKSTFALLLNLFQKEESTREKGSNRIFLAQQLTMMGREGSGIDAQAEERDGREGSAGMGLKAVPWPSL